MKPVFRTLDVNVPRGASVSRADVVAYFVGKGLLSSLEAVVMTRFGYQVTFTSHGVMARFGGEVVIGGFSCPVRWVEPFLTLRLHWLPYFVSVEAISALLAPYGKVLSVGHVNGLDHLPNGVRLVRLEGGGILRGCLTWTGWCMKGSLSPVCSPSRGGPPLCLRCRATGHLRGECPGRSAAFTYAGRVAQLTSDLGQVEVEEAGEPVVDRVDGRLVGAPVSGAGPGSDIGGDREPESGRVVVQAGVEALVGVEGGGGAPLQSEVTPGGGTVDVASGAVPRPPRGGGSGREGAVLEGGQTPRFGPGGRGWTPRCRLTTGRPTRAFKPRRGVSFPALCQSLPLRGGVGGDPVEVGVLGRAPVAGPAFHALPPVVSRPLVGVLEMESGGQLPPS